MSDDTTPINGVPADQPAEEVQAEETVTEEPAADPTVTPEAAGSEESEPSESESTEEENAASPAEEEAPAEAPAVPAVVDASQAAPLPVAAPTADQLRGHLGRLTFEAAGRIIRDGEEVAPGDPIQFHDGEEEHVADLLAAGTIITIAD